MKKASRQQGCRINFVPKQISPQEALEMARSVVRNMVIEERIKKTQEEQDKITQQTPGAAIAFGNCRLAAMLVPVKGIDK